MNGPVTDWVDKETFFILKSILYSLDGQHIERTMGVSRVQYNLELPNSLFSVIGLPGETVGVGPNGEAGNGR